MKIFDWLIKILLVLLCGAIYLWAGIKWSKGTEAISSLAFDQGWLLVALLVSQFIAIRLGDGKLGQPNWPRIIPACLVGFALEALSDHLFLRLREHPSKNQAIAFSVSASLFLVNIVAWIVFFPYEDFFGRDSAGERRSLQGLVRATGILVAAIIICGVGWYLLMTGIPISNTISALQAWFYKAALLVYLFLALRIFYPMFEPKLRQPPPWP